MNLNKIVKFALILAVTAVFSCADFSSIEHELNDKKVTINYRSDNPNLDVVLHKVTLDYKQDGIFIGGAMFGDSVLLKVDLTLRNLSSEDLNITKKFGVYDYDNDKTWYVPADMPIVAEDDINRAGDTNGTLKGYQERTGSSYLIVSERKESRFLLENYELVIDKKRIPFK